MSRFSLIAAVALTGLIACAPVLKAADSTNTPPAAGEPGAKPKGGKGGGANGPIMELIKKLDLNDEQKEKVREVMKTQQEKMVELRKDTSLSREDKMTKMKELRDSMKEEMKKILTPEQFTKFEDGLKTMGPGGGKRPGGPGAPSATPGAGTTPPPNTN